MAHEVRANVPEPFAVRRRGGREFPNGEWVTLSDEEWKGELGDAIRGDAAFEHRRAKAGKATLVQGQKLTPEQQAEFDKVAAANQAALDAAPVLNDDTPPAPNPEAVNLTPHDSDPGKSQEALPK